MDIASDVSKRMTPTSKIDKSKPKASTVKYVLRKNNIHRATVYNNIINNTFTISPTTYSLDLLVNSVSENGSTYDGDYSDFTTMDNIQSGNTSYTEVNISLSKNETALPASSKSIDLYWNSVNLNQTDGTSPYFLNEKGEQINDGNSVTTDESGNVKLFWLDEGISFENIVIACLIIACNYIRTYLHASISWSIFCVLKTSKTPNIRIYLHATKSVVTGKFYSYQIALLYSNL